MSIRIKLQLFIVGIALMISFSWGIYEVMQRPVAGLRSEAEILDDYTAAIANLGIQANLLLVRPVETQLDIFKEAVRQHDEVFAHIQQISAIPAINPSSREAFQKTLTLKDVYYTNVKALVDGSPEFIEHFNSVANLIHVTSITDLIGRDLSGWYDVGTYLLLQYISVIDSLSTILDAVLSELEAQQAAIVIEVDKAGKNRLRVTVMTVLAFLSVSVALALLIARQFDKRIVQLQDYLANIVNSMPSIIIGVDAHGRVTQWNDKVAAETSLASKEALGKSVEMVFPEIGDNLDQIRESVEKKTVVRFSKVVKEHEKEERHEEITIYPLTGDENTGAVLRIDDVTKSKHMAKQLEQSRKMEAIGLLAGGIAHDFNNLLAAILGYTELSRLEVEKGSTVHKNLGQIMKAGIRARDLVKQILLFSRQVESESIPVPMRTIIKEAVKMLRPTLPTTIEIRSEFFTERDLVLADPSRINQVIMNIGTNAYHSMEESGGLLEITLKNRLFAKEDLKMHQDVKPGNYVQMSVRDTGSGIPKDILDKIFEPYFTTKESGKGTGMGLSIVHGIAKEYGGFISCYSKVDAGTVFHVFLPVLEGDQAVPDEEHDLIFSTANEHVLLVDDEEMITQMTSNLLAHLGYRVTGFNSSKQALAAFKENPGSFDIVITDQTMPEMTGIELSQELIAIRPGIPIILCTGYSSTVTKEKARSIGVRKFAYKPLSSKDFSVLIASALDKIGS